MQKGVASPKKVTESERRKAGSARGNWGARGYAFPTGLNSLLPPPVWEASAVIGQVASRQEGARSSTSSLFVFVASKLSTKNIFISSYERILTK